ncbi:glycosyltransferase [Oleiharenicola lentus]|uniref:glycosyltransferase n=1 Tax=Oleiharenicola lentus TaxID=2508720 RepID=UPI003F676218
MKGFTLIGEIESPRPLRAIHGRISVTGWCLAQGEAFPPPVRLSVGVFILESTSQRERTDVAALLPNEKAASHSGFLIEGTLPPGVHDGRFEAKLPDGTWAAFKQFSIASEAPPFVAVIDTPISEGVLRDRVKIGGWALDPAQSVKSLTVRYGHRRIDCVINQPRSDVPTAFPHVLHAARSGFVSDDFLVAGHGAVRVRAILADGRMVVAPTKVSFSVATDENHEAELDLTAARIGLIENNQPRETPPTDRAPRPLNIVFILPGSFASNSALHIAALANELAAAGHDCLVAVARDVETIDHLDRPAFGGLTHAQADNYLGFADKRGPDIIHAWTTSENVRLLSEKLRSKYRAKVLVHLEDNERQILALSSKVSINELSFLPDHELDQLVQPTMSHPHRSRGFLSRCDGVTVIMDRLQDFAPDDKPCITLNPAMDARWFYPRAVPKEFRDALQLPADTTVLFYHGNVHASNAAEVRELYAAVLELNRTGSPVTLIRTGLDRVDFLKDIAPEVAPFVLSLGLITHHHHLPALMALADIFVQPGWADAFNDYRFPSKLPEFFAIGRPVVLPRANLGTTLAHGVDAYVVERADAARIAAAVRTLRADPTLAARLSAGALAYAEKNFNWRRSAATLANFYTTLAAS